MKESRRFWISVEGENCERLYFEHLAALINGCDACTYKASIKPLKASPYSFAKRNSYKLRDRKSSGSSIPYIHVQDIEDYYHPTQRRRFLDVIDEMRKAESEFGIDYELGYSNYTFELWMLLHVADMGYSVPNRHAYLEPVNRWFRKDYRSLDAFKARDEFQSVLTEFVTIDSVKKAIVRAKRLDRDALENPERKLENYRNFKFYQDNPHTTVHGAVEMIFDVCGVPE